MRDYPPNVHAPVVVTCIRLERACMKTEGTAIKDIVEEVAMEKTE